MGRTRTRLMLRLKVHWSVRRSAGRGRWSKQEERAYVLTLSSICGHAIVTPFSDYTTS